MFRSIRRTKREIDISLAKDLLINERRAVLAVNGDESYPYCMPINYIYIEEDNKIYFHGARAGHKYDSLKKDDKVCLTVFGNDRYEDGDWAPYVQSTVVFGRCHMIEDTERALELVKIFAMKYYPDEKEADDEIKLYGDAVQMFEINIEHITGKQIHEK